MTGMFSTLAVLGVVSVGVQNPNPQSPEAMARATELRAIVQRAPRLSLEPTEIKPTPPREGWAMGMVSWVAADRNGLIYLLQRGDKADPVVVMNKDGKVVRSWGAGMYVMPHAIRIDPQGNVWTTDAASSMVIKFSPDGTKLMDISVGGQPTPCRNNFCGTTDIAFAPNGHLFISDGYANARILEYTADGRKVREWGAPGTGPGQFRLPHSIQIDEDGIVYVADRENGRVQRFDQRGKYLGEWATFGKTFSLKLVPGAVWLATQQRNEPNLSPGWLMKIDRKTGNVLGYVEVTGVHGMEAMPNGEVMVGPGPGLAAPQWFKVPAPRYTTADGKLRVALAQQPFSPNGTVVGPRTMADGGIQPLLAGLGATVRIDEAALTADENTEYGGWKRLGMALGHFADIVSKNERDGYFTVGLYATCPSMPGMVAGLQHSGPTREPIRVGMLWLDAHPDFNTPDTTRSGSLGGMPVAVATGRALQGMRLDAHLDPPLSDTHVVMGGVRLVDPLEQQLLDSSRIEQVSVDDLRRATPAVFAQLDRLSRITDTIYVHIDMDVLDPREVMAHQNKVPGGPSSEELAALFEKIFSRYPKASAIGFATIPATDEGGLSIAAVNRMIAGAVRGVKARETHR